MPLKIRPNAIEQEEGSFIFPGVISMVGTTEFTFDADGVTGSSLVSARDTSSGFKTPVTIRGSAIHLVGNEDLVALRIEEGGGQGWLKINPTAKDYDLSYLADDGTVLLYGDAGNGYIGIGTDTPQRRFVVADSSVNIGLKNTLDGRGWSLYAPGGAVGELVLWAHHDAAWTQGEYVISIYPTGSIVFNPLGVASRDFLVKSDGQATLFYCDAGTHTVGVGTSASNRLFEVSNPSGESYIRIDGNSGSSVQLEYSRDGNYAWVGPTAGGDFHLWSQENGAVIIGVDNTEVMRWHGDGYGEMSGVSASPTGTIVPSDSLRMWVTEPLVGETAMLMMNDFEKRMVGFPQGYYCVINSAATSISASPTYTKMPWNGLLGGNLHRTSVGMLTHSIGSSDTDVIIRDDGLFEIHVDVTIDITSGTSRSTCHGYIDKNGSKLTGTDFYTYNRDATNGEGSASTFWIGTLDPGDVISVKVSRVAGTDTCVNLSGGTRLLIKQIGFSW